MRIRFMIALVVTIAVATTMAFVPTGLADERNEPLATGEFDSVAVRDSARLEAAERDRAIAFYERRLTEDPASALDLAQLAGHFLQRARETGSVDDFTRAELAARRSLSLRVNRNAKTYVTLASTLLAQHRFRDAEAAARSAVDYDPDEPAYWSLFAEVTMERGAYADAAAAFDSVRRGPRSISSSTRLARWSELTGNTAAARRLLNEAIVAARSRRDLTREHRAWYSLQLGELEARHGNLAAADSILRAALRYSPDDHRVLGALARVAADRGHFRDAVRFGDRGLATVLDPATLAVMSEASLAMGDTARAEEFADGVRLAALGQPGPLHREWSLFLLDRNIGTGEILRRVRAEAADRSDVYSLDLLAWALHQSDRDAEASAVMRKAMEHGTQSALLHYHHGEIQRALGDAVAARASFERSRQLNRFFRPAALALARLGPAGGGTATGDGR